VGPRCHDPDRRPSCGQRDWRATARLAILPGRPAVERCAAGRVFGRHSGPQP
jgi:hypothetical protein